MQLLTPVAPYMPHVPLYRLLKTSPLFRASPTAFAGGSYHRTPAVFLRILFAHNVGTSALKSPGKSRSSPKSITAVLPVHTPVRKPVTTVYAFHTASGNHFTPVFCLHTAVRKHFTPVFWLHTVVRKHFTRVFGLHTAV